MARIFGIDVSGAAVISVAALALASACTVHNAEQPALTGPSGLAQSISLTATPDRLTQNGQDQSAIVVRVLGPSGAPASGIALRVDMLVDGTLVDFGTLSARSLVTDSAGRASVIYTAPPAPPPLANSGSTGVTIRAIALGTNAQSSVPFTTDIRLTPPGVILPPAETPAPSFAVTPSPVNINIAAAFDASASCPGVVTNGACGGSSSIISYTWAFGDGSTSTGPIVSHTFTATGTFSVTLTIVNDRNVSASTTKVIAVGASVAPAALFVFSPTTPVVGQSVVFNADASRAAPGHTIVQYSWIFGDGTTDTGFLVSHAFSTPGTYNVSLTVADETGQKATVAVAVPIN